MRSLFVACFLLVTTPLVSAEDLICRYCQEGHPTCWPWDSICRGKYHYAPDRKVDVQHIKLDVTPDFEKRTVRGTVSITASPIAQPVELLDLDAKDISVKRVQCEEAEVQDFVSTRESLQILFENPIAVGQAFTVVIEYSAQPDAGLYFRTPAMGYPATDTHIWTQGETHEARHWFPCFDYPNERSSTEVICHVPRDMTVLSNGERRGEKIDNNGLKAVHWYHEKPHANYLICLVAGHLEGLEKQHRNVPLGFYTQPSLPSTRRIPSATLPTSWRFSKRRLGSIPLAQVRPGNHSRLHCRWDGEHDANNTDRRDHFLGSNGKHSYHAWPGCARIGPPMVWRLRHLQRLEPSLAERGIRHLLHTSVRRPQVWSRRHALRPVPGRHRPCPDTEKRQEADRLQRLQEPDGTFDYRAYPKAVGYCTCCGRNLARTFIENASRLIWNSTP